MRTQGPLSGLLVLMFIGVACMSNSSDACPGGGLTVHTDNEPQAVLDAAGEGGTLCFEAGIYRLDEALQPLAGQSLFFAPGAVLNGSEIVTNWSTQGSYWSSTGHEQNWSDGAGLPDKELICQETPTACVYEDLYLDGQPLRHVPTLSALDEPDEVYFDEAADTMFIATDPTNRVVEATVAGMAIASSADDVTIRGATIEKFAYTGINTDGDSWTIERSEIRYVHFQGIGIYNSTGHVIRDTRVHLCGMIGMTALGVDDFTIEGNQFDHNNYLRAGPKAGGHHEGSIKILGSHDVTFRDNWSHHNIGDGLWFDWDNYDILIEKNLLESNSRHGLQYEASFDATVRYNTIRNNGTDWDSQGAGILNSTSSNVEYYGNRIENNVIRPIVILWQDRGQSATLGERQSANLYFHDNVIVLDENSQSWLGAYWDQDPRVLTSNNRFEGNSYHAQGTGESWWLWGSHLTWRQWQSHGFDTTGSYLRNETRAERRLH